MQPVMTEHAKRVQRMHFQRRIAPTSPEPGTPAHLLPKMSSARDEIEEVAEDRTGGSQSGSGSQQDLSANDLEKALEDVERQGAHVGGSVWAHSVPGNEAPHLEQPVLSTSFPRFHLDLYVTISTEFFVYGANFSFPLAALPRSQRPLARMTGDDARSSPIAPVPFPLHLMSIEPPTRLQAASHAYTSRLIPHRKSSHPVAIFTFIPRRDLKIRPAYRRRHFAGLFCVHGH